MKVIFSVATLPSSGTLVVPIFDDHKSIPASLAPLLSRSAKSLLNKALNSAKSLEKEGGNLAFFSLPDLDKVTVILWNAGSRREFNSELFGAKVIKKFLEQGESDFSFYLNGSGLLTEESALVAVGARLASYRFDKHRSKSTRKRATAINTIRIIDREATPARQCYRSFLGPVCDGQLLARDLVNEPANVLFPKAYSRRIKSLTQLGLKIQILGEKEMATHKMNALLGVGQGSSRESQLVIVKWMGGRKSDAPVCLVGKGITFDSGGISIKPTNGMWNMKGDMGGSAAVVGAMQALAARNAKVNVVGIVALAENMPDGNAQNPGDVITSMSGQTIELQSTDAEGRLVLADAITYAKKFFNPCAIVDLATLTGAKLVALGSEHAALFSNDDELAKQFERSSAKSGERTWRLPLLPEYDQLLQSETADMKNSVAGGAGSITAAQFLQRFVGKTPWVHLDVAGSATKLTRNDPREPSFATGYGVRLLNQWIASNYE